MAKLITEIEACAILSAYPDSEEVAKGSKIKRCVDVVLEWDAASNQWLWQTPTGIRNYYDRPKPKQDSKPIPAKMGS